VPSLYRFLPASTVLYVASAVLYEASTVLYVASTVLYVASIRYVTFAARIKACPPPVSDAPAKGKPGITGGTALGDEAADYSGLIQNPIYILINIYK